MLGTDGQKARNVQEAAAYIREFMQFERDYPEQINRGKDHDFDLYLPWMMEVVNNAPEEEGSRPPTELDALYMDAAWALVQEGYIRPGPRTVSGDNPPDGYGKGFSLTPKGRDWIELEVRSERPQATGHGPGAGGHRPQVGGLRPDN